VLTTGDGTQASTLYDVWQMLKKFLGIPLLMLLIATLLSLLLYTLDRNTPGGLRPVRDWLERHFFSTSETTGAFLGIVAGGMFTQTSIVVSMLLLILQQTASVMGNFIYDQFLRRHRNQVFAGYVTGTLLMALLLRITVHDGFNPVLSATGMLVIVTISIGMLVWFLSSTIEQMRPEVVVATIHDQTNRARERELDFLRRVRSRSQMEHPPQVRLQANTHGFLAQIDFDEIEACVEEHVQGSVEVIFRIELGDYVAYHESIADIKATDAAEAERLAHCVGDALRFSQQRNMGQDPAYGIKQLEVIGWTVISTAEDTPETAIIVLHALRDLLSRWIWTDAEAPNHPQKLPVVYEQDTRLAIIDAWESLATVSTESMQHQPFGEILKSIARLYAELPTALQDRTDRLLERAVSGMGDHILTQDVDSSLHDLIQALEDAARYETAGMVTEARNGLAGSLGRLANRSTRVEHGGQGDG
jgi:uncharacterized membrane protein